MRPLAPPLSLTILATALALATALPAQAHHGGRHGGHAGHGHPGHHGGHGLAGGWGHKHHGHHRGSVWGPLIVGGLIGAAVAHASTAQAQTQPPAVVVPWAPAVASHLIPAPIAPPMVIAPAQPAPTRVQYYCAPYRAHYPVVSSCPEPWYVMPY